jgi:hypothetical protein
MQLKLNYWKVILLLIPFIVASLLMDLGNTPGNSHKAVFAIANYLLIIDILLINACQVIILIGFINVTNKNDWYFKINALIPIGFLIIYLLYVVYFSLTRLHMNSNYGSLKKSDLHGSTLILFVFFIYTAINFLFTNNNYVSWEIKRMKDADKQAELKSKYLKPMRVIVRTSVWVGVACLLISTIIDLTRLL